MSSASTAFETCPFRQPTAFLSSFSTFWPPSFFSFPARLYRQSSEQRGPLQAASTSGSERRLEKRWPYLPSGSTGSTTSSGIRQSWHSSREHLPTSSILTSQIIS